MRRVAWLIIWTIKWQYLFRSFQNLIPHDKVLIKIATTIQGADVKVSVQVWKTPIIQMLCISNWLKKKRQRYFPEIMLTRVISSSKLERSHFPQESVIEPCSFCSVQLSWLTSKERSFEISRKCTYNLRVLSFATWNANGKKLLWEHDKISKCFICISVYFSFQFGFL